MRYLTLEAKKALVEKVLTRKEGQTFIGIAKQNNISCSALREYMKLCREDKSKNGPVGVLNGAELSSAERFEHVVATATFTESERGSYCRERGLYSFQLQEWKEACMAPPKSEQSTEQERENKVLRAEIKALRSDLNRKDRALAEASALLILKKKAALIWGEAEDACSLPSKGDKP